MSDIDGVAFTRGPGIGGCLSVGSNAAKNLAAALGKPLVGVHHMVRTTAWSMPVVSLLNKNPVASSRVDTFAHIPIAADIPIPDYLNFGRTYNDRSRFKSDRLPYSGHHGRRKYRVRWNVLSRSLRLNSISFRRNAFDKVSRFLAISWSHSSDKPIGPGAALERFALSYPDTDSSNLITPSFPVPMRSQLAFSFAGLVSSVQRHLSLIPPQELTNERKAAIARSFQAAAAGQIEEKLKLALRWCEREGIKVTTVVASGGVASNMYLRERLVHFLVCAHFVLNVMSQA